MSNSDEILRLVNAELISLLEGPDGVIYRNSPEFMRAVELAQAGMGALGSA